MTKGVCTGIADVPCLRGGVNASVKFFLQAQIFALLQLFL